LHVDESNVVGVKAVVAAEELVMEANEVGVEVATIIVELIVGGTDVPEALLANEALGGGGGTKDWEPLPIGGADMVAKIEPSSSAIDEACAVPKVSDGKKSNTPGLPNARAAVSTAVLFCKVVVAVVPVTSQPVAVVQTVVVIVSTDELAVVESLK
jgi:hypothetical protein